MKRIVIFSNHDLYTYKLRKELIERLINEAYEVYLVLPYGSKVELLKQMGCELINVEFDRRGRNPIRDAKLLLRYYKVVQAVKPQAVLSYTVKPNIYAGLVCRILRIPFFPNVTGLGTALDNVSILQRVLVQMYRLAYAKATCVFFQNKENESFFSNHGVRIERHRLIPGSGVNLDQHYFEPYPGDDKTIKFLFMGRIMKDKGIEELMEAATAIKSQFANVRFDAIGFVEEEYRARADEISELGVINFHGVVDDVHEYIKSCHAVVLPSYHEGMANVLLEAASTGRPILASNISGCKEIFDEGVSGFGFEPRNSCDLADALRRFIGLPLERKGAMGLAGRKKMEQEFDRSLVVEAYLDEIDRIVG